MKPDNMFESQTRSRIKMLNAVSKKVCLSGVALLALGTLSGCSAARPSRFSALSNSAFSNPVVDASGTSGNSKFSTANVSAIGLGKTSLSKQAWVADGMITVARVAPAPQSIAPQSMLGFLPGTFAALSLPAEHVGPWLSIDRTQHTASLMDGSSLVECFKGEGLENISSGTFHLALKQRNPLWYAPDSYFSAREISVPPPGDKSRFRRGALGDFALFLDKNTPVHSGPMWIKDIGGARLDENDLSRIYYHLNVGSIVEVK